MYDFTSERLGFRNWSATDLDALHAINSDPIVMEHFPSTLTRQETEAFLERMQKHYHTHGYTYYAVDLLDSQELIGFIGMAYQDYPTDFNPSTDIGWRLKPSAWGKGYATEGAKACLHHAFSNLGLTYITAVCTSGNINSAKVMKKIGMQYGGTFKHPKLEDYPDLQECLWYEVRI